MGIMEMFLSGGFKVYFAVFWFILERIMRKFSIGNEIFWNKFQSDQIGVLVVLVKIQGVVH